MAIILIYLSIITAEPFPSINIGIKSVKFNTTFIKSDIYGNELRIFENYIGIGADVILTTFDFLCIRLEICELRKYQYLGDIKFVKLSNLSLDVEFIIPTSKSFSFIGYIGTKYGPFDYRFPRDTIFGIVNREFHSGVGLLFRLNSKFKIIFENQIYSDNKWWYYHNENNYDHIQTWGFERLNLGIRYKIFNLF